VIGSRALSNGNASGKNFRTEIKQPLDLQGVGVRIKKFAKFYAAVIPVSFCARNKIFASFSVFEQPGE
jgi:hypothetical protein